MIAAYLMPIDMIADKRGLVVNAGIKLGYRLPGMRKYLPAFRAAGAGGSAGSKPWPHAAIKRVSWAVLKGILPRPSALKILLSRYPVLLPAIRRDNGDRSAPRLAALHSHHATQDGRYPGCHPIRGSRRHYDEGSTDLTEPPMGG